MEIFDNITKVVRDDIAEKATGKSRISIAAACFSIYAYKELKKQLEGVKERQCEILSVNSDLL